MLRDNTAVRHAILIDWECFDYLDHINFAVRLENELRMVLLLFAKGDKSDKEFLELFLGCHDYAHVWLKRSENVDKDALSEEPRSNFIIFRKVLHDLTQQLLCVGRRYDFIMSKRNESHHSSADDLMQFRSEPILFKPMLRRVKGGLFDPDVLSPLAARHAVPKKSAAARRAAFHEKSKLERTAPPVKYVPASMKYGDLNIFYKKRVSARFDQYRTVIGGVDMQWRVFKDIEDSRTFAEFEMAGLTAAMESPWKIHISVDSRDLGKAWNRIYPILMKYQVPHFKVTRLAVADKEVKALMQADPDALHMTKDDIKLACYDQERISKGMQITIYIPIKEEKPYNLMLSRIETVLCAGSIRPGVIDKSDRAIGIYSSVRHVGSFYTRHDLVKGHKEVEVGDPFRPVPIDWAGVKHVDWKRLHFASQLKRAEECMEICKKTAGDYQQAYQADERMRLKRLYSQTRQVAYEFYERWRSVLEHVIPTLSTPFPTELTAFQTKIEEGLAILKGDHSFENNHLKTNKPGRS